MKTIFTKHQLEDWNMFLCKNYSGGFIYTLCALTSMASLKVYTRQPL